MHKIRRTLTGDVSLEVQYTSSNVKYPHGRWSVYWSLHVQSVNEFDATATWWYLAVSKVRGGAVVRMRHLAEKFSTLLKLLIISIHVGLSNFS